MTYEELTQIVAKYSDLCKCPELKENPFRKRICKVFSVDDSGNLTFDQFVYLFSVFSEKAPREMKVQFAFKIYGNSSILSLFSYSADYWFQILMVMVLLEPQTSKMPSNY